MNHTHTLKECLTVLDRVSWLNVPGFVAGEFEGYRDLKFGIYAGDNTVFNLLHEIAHACEITDTEVSRLALHNYGLRITTIVEIPGYPTFAEPTTSQASMREARVFAIQKHLMEALNINTQGFLAEVVSVMKWLPDYYNIAKGNADTPEWEATAMDIIQNEYNKTSIANIKQQWTLAISFINAVSKES